MNVVRKLETCKQEFMNLTIASQYSSVRICKIVYQRSLQPNFATNRQQTIVNQTYLMSIVVRPIQATLTRDVDLITKMDPFCKIYLGGQLQQTKVCQGGGKNPTWNSNLTFHSTGDNNLRVQVWDHDTIGSDDVIGVGNINLTSVMQQGIGSSLWIDLFHKGASAGRICLAIEMENVMKPGMQFGQGVGQGVGQGLVQGQGMGTGSWGQQHPGNIGQNRDQ